ncbi:MAG: ABC transporter permease [Alphaproteobacteria bacterium]
MTQARTQTLTQTLTQALRLMAQNPLIPLTLLLFLLIGALELMQPGIVNPRWTSNTLKFAIPLAMLAACQTLTMLTGGIDLSAGTSATITAFVTATLTPLIGVPMAVTLGLTCALTAGLFNGLGIAVARVHPLIMTLGTALIANGCLLVYQRFVIASGTRIPDVLVWLGTGRTFGLPNGLALFVPFAALILWTEKRTGFGRLLYAIGSNESATRLAGVRRGPVLFALYALSGLIAGLTGLLYLGLVKTASLSLALPLDLPSVAAAVIGGTSIFGGRGGYAGTIIGALILTVLATMLTLLQMPEGARRILFGLIILAVTALYIRLTEKG